MNEHEDEIDSIVGEWTLKHRLGALEKMLDEASVPAARIYTMADVFDDPHYKAREMIVEVPDDDLGTVKLANVVPRLSATPGEIRKAGGQPGVDTADVLLELAGLDAAAIAALEAEGIIYCGEETSAATREAD